MITIDKDILEIPSHDQGVEHPQPVQIPLQPELYYPLDSENILEVNQKPAPEKRVVVIDLA